jgi:hypothetical protein
MKTTGLVSTLFALAAFAADAPAQDSCDRACLTGFVDDYFDALAAGDARSLPLARNAKITLNGRETDLAQTLWDGAGETVYRWDIVNERLGDTGTEAVVRNDDGSKTIVALRLKVLDGAVTEVEIIRANQGDADGLWGPDTLAEVSPFLTLSIREADRDSYYGLIAAAEGYWRAFQTNGSALYHPADLLPDSRRYENGLQTTGLVRNGEYVSTAEGFDQGRFVARNLWDRRYPVVDTERGIVLSIVRFGLKDDMQSQSAATSNDRLVAEFFAVKSGMIQEIHAVLFNLPDEEPTGWEPDYGPPRGGR